MAALIAALVKSFANMGMVSKVAKKGGKHALKAAKKHPLCPSHGRVDGKTIIVTGANTGIGFETSRELARRGGKIILACRDMEKATATASRITEEMPKAEVVPMQVDLSEMSSVRAFCAEFLKNEPKLNIIINNAGIGSFLSRKPHRREKGLEEHFAVNTLAPFLIINILLPRLVESGGGRIITVSSDGHKLIKHFHPDNLNSEKHYNGMAAYCVSKLCDVFITRELDRKLRMKGLSPSKIQVVALNPGHAKSDLLRYEKTTILLRLIVKLLSLLAKDNVEAAATTVYCAVASELDGYSGGYYANCEPCKVSHLAMNTDHAKLLWAKCEKYVDLQESENWISTHD